MLVVPWPQLCSLGGRSQPDCPTGMNTPSRCHGSIPATLRGTSVSSCHLGTQTTVTPSPNLFAACQEVGQLSLESCFMLCKDTMCNYSLIVLFLVWRLRNRSYLCSTTDWFSKQGLTQVSCSWWKKPVSAAACAWVCSGSLALGVWAWAVASAAVIDECTHRS